MRALARRLIAVERRAGDPDDNDGRAALRVCEKLREFLAPLTGKRGYKALLARAQALAIREVSWLEKVQLGDGGSILVPGVMEDELGADEAVRGGLALVTHLLELLSTFIGAALTLRLVQQVWPKAPLEEPKSEGKT